MKKKQLCIIFFLLSSFAFANSNISNKENEGFKNLYIKSMSALKEENYEDAHSIADTLIHEYSDTYQPTILINLYQTTLYFLNEDFRRENFNAVNAEVMKKMNEIKNKKIKDITDLVILAKMSNGFGKGINITYLDEIIKLYPDNLWADWAIMQKGIAEIAEKYHPQEFERLFSFGKKFISEHPNSHVLPEILAAMGTWAYYLDQESKQESIQMCLRCLQDYPIAEEFSALARINLREFLGDEYKEAPGWSKEKDFMIVKFYNSPIVLNDLKNGVDEYLTIAQSIPVDLPYPYEVAGIDNRIIDKSPIKLYIVSGVLGISIAGLFLFYKKKYLSKAK